MASFMPGSGSEEEIPTAGRCTELGPGDRSADVGLDHPRRSCRSHRGAGRGVQPLCERAGRYRLEALIARHGPAFGIPDLLRVLSEFAPKRASVSAYDLCRC